MSGQITFPQLLWLLPRGGIGQKYGVVIIILLVEIVLNSHVVQPITDVVKSDHF